MSKDNFYHSEHYLQVSSTIFKYLNIDKGN